MGRGVLLLALALFSACGGGSGGGLNFQSGVFGPEVHGTPDTFRGAGIINDGAFLIGGPLAQGREGDVLLQNDQVRIIIQKPTRNTGVGLYGGNIIDADRFRPSSEPGQDQFGSTFPLINLAWTANWQRLEIINADFANGPVVLRATGALDVYDYIQTNIIAPFAKVTLGADLFYADRFDDVFNPFENVPELRNLSQTIVTDYTLKADASYLIIETRLQNNGEEAIKMPFGDWLNGSGTLAPFVPTKGFLNTALVEPAPGLIYQGMEDNVDVSYGYFFNPIQIMDADGNIPGSASLTVSGVTPIVLGENFLQLIPIGAQDPKINFTIEPGVKTITRYFAIGDGDVASVLSGGFKALGVSKAKMTGVVTDGGGSGVGRTRVVVLDGGIPVTSAFTDANGEFSAEISSGSDVKAKMFGSGSYEVVVYKEGYVMGSGPAAGQCSGGSFDSAAKIFSGIECTLGSSGTLSVSASEDGQPIPARVTIVGFDPSPIHNHEAPEDFGKFGDIALSERPYGVVDLFYLDPAGQVFPSGHARRMGGNQVRLEPGEYTVFVTRGPEYSVYKERVTIGAGGSAAVDATLSKVLDTQGFVCADLHLHGIKSADSAWGLESRVRAAMAEGMDILVSTDHDFVTDYAPVIESLGVGNYLTSLAGDEITPLAFGHLLAFPLTPDPNSTTGGAYDYTYVPEDDTLGPQPDYGQTVEQIIQGIDESNPGTQVFQIAHIMDKATGMFGITGLVTSTEFDGVEPLSTYGDPVRYRMPPNTNTGGNFQSPFPFGTSPLFTTKFTSMELTIGAYPDTVQHLMETSLPTYFNLLNLGLIRSATGSSDSHTQVREPMGSPRNYIVSAVDPRDGVGSSYAAIDGESIAQATNSQQLLVTNGVFIRPRLKTPSNPSGVGVGGTVSGGGTVTLELDISSNEYIDWDTVEIYANTPTTPAKDDMSGVTDLDARQFHKVSNNHVPKYLMAPIFSYHRGGSGDALLNQSVADGVRSSFISKDFNFSEDTWIVVVVRGVNTSSVFPFVTKGTNTAVAQENFLDVLDSDPRQIGGVPAFGFTNPMFVDVEGDGFTALYQRQGKSPL